MILQVGLSAEKEATAAASAALAAAKAAGLGLQERCRFGGVCLEDGQPQWRTASFHTIGFP